MQLQCFQIDAFTDKVFCGNPACVVSLNKWLPDDIMLKIARENGVAETAFFIDNGQKIQLRWFTPDIEMDLCGHATLATAHCIITILGLKKNNVVFETKSGLLSVILDNQYYKMDLPAREAIKESLPSIIKDSLNILPKEVLKARDYLLVYDNENDVKNIKIDRPVFDRINLNPGGVIVTAKGNDCDFVSRFFTPQATILEDPVTGSAHCSLIPYWAKKLNKTKLAAKQISERGGQILCENLGERVVLRGQAKTYSIGNIFID